jgi:hypothetical protein
LPQLNQISAGGSLQILENGALTVAGGLDIRGIITLSPGTLTIPGTYTQEASGALAVGVGGLTAGTQFGQLNVTGQVPLDGALNISLLNGYSPPPGDSYRIMTFGSRSGDFTVETGLYLGGGEGFNPTYDSSGLSLVVIPEEAGTTTTLASSLNPSTYGQSVTFTGTVVSTLATGFTPTGTVNFYDGGSVLGTAALGSDGTASFATSTLTTGDHVIVAQYSGDSNFSGSNSTPLTQDVSQDGSSTIVASSLNPSTYGQSLTFTATISAASGSGTPTGTVTFYDGSTVLGTEMLSGGLASFTTSDLTVGDHSITAAYSGDFNFSTSTSAVFTQTIQRPATATLSGKVFDDLDGDGSLAGGEPGLSGWTVQVLDTSNTVVATSTTDSGGAYSFAAIDPGLYTVSLIATAGYIATTAASGTIPVSASAGQSVSGLNFGEFQAATFSGQLFDDSDQDGLHDEGELGLSDWTVGLLNSVNEVVGTATTDLSGAYSFTNLSPGNYTIAEVLQPGYIATAPASGFLAFVPTSGEHATGNDFGVFKAVSLTVTGLTTSPSTGLQSGMDVVVKWIDTNTGTLPAEGSFTDLVTITNATTGQVLADASVPYDASTLGNLAAGASASEQYAFRLPDGSPGVGQILFTVTTDANNSVSTPQGGSPRTATLTGTSTLAPYPDLVIGEITAPATALPGQTIKVGLTLANHGTGAATGTWTDQLFLSDDANVGDDLFLGNFSFTGTLDAGQTLTRNLDVILPQFAGGNFRIVARTNAGNRPFELDPGNNATIDDQTIGIVAALGLTASRGTIVEGSPGPAATLTVARNGSTAADLVVSLASSDPASLGVPASVTIPAGQTSAQFGVYAPDNALVDGDRTVTVLATSAGFDNGAASLTITDDDVPTLTISIGTETLAEDASNPAANAVLTRNTSTATDLVVHLLSDNIGRLTVPASVTIPAGQASVSVPITVINNNVIDGTSQVTISAASTGFVSGSKQVSVTDDDVVNLGLHFSTEAVTEGSPSPAAIGTVVRDVMTNQPLTVTLTSSSSLASVPTQVTIPANQASVTFAINVPDDTIVNGTRSVIIGAYLTTASGAVLGVGATSTTLTILDNDGPTLTLSAPGGAITEGATRQGVVSRNTDTTNDLMVTLTSGDTTEVAIPATVTIPAGQSSAFFPIHAVLDGVADGLQTATIVASAAGFNAGSAEGDVSDVDLPDLRVTGVTVPTTGQSGTTINVSWTVANGGVVPATGSWTDRVYLSTDDQLGDDTLLGSQGFSGSLAVGDSYPRSLTITLPDTIATYYIFVVSDATGFLGEGSEGNNARVSGAIDVQPAYRATVSAAITTANAGTPVPLTGTAFDPLTGTPAANQPVTIRIYVRGIRRDIAAVTDAKGNFSATFQPLPGEAGHYTIGADHPGVATDAVQDEFSLVGMRANQTQIDVRIAPGTPLSGQVQLTNLGDVPLTGLTASVLNAPGNIGVQPTPPSGLDGLAADSLAYSISASDASQLEGHLVLHITSAEGAVLDVPLNVTVVPLTPQLVANPGFLERGMVRGQQAVVSFVVSNLGGAPSGDLHVLLPSAPWLSLATASTIPSLAPGATATVILTLTPAADLPLTVFSGSLALVGSNVELSLPFSFRSVSTAVGDIRVSVVDEYTFYADGSPQGAGATVTLTDAISGAILGQQVTDSSGIIVFSGESEGRYNIDVTAPGHTTIRQLAVVVPDQTTESEVFLHRQFVSYGWQVVPTGIEDHYKLAVETTFQTNVPAPVVTIDKPLIIPMLLDDQPTVINVTLTNHGLIAAEDVHFLPPADNPAYTITPLVMDIGTLPAKTSITIPVMFRAKPGIIPQQMTASLVASEDGGPGLLDWFCGRASLEFIYDYKCGNWLPQLRGNAQVAPLPTTEECLEHALQSVLGIPRSLKDWLEDKLRSIPMDEWNKLWNEIVGSDDGEEEGEEGKGCEIASELAKCLVESQTGNEELACYAGAVVSAVCGGAWSAAADALKCLICSTESLGGDVEGLSGPIVVPHGGGGDGNDRGGVVLIRDDFLGGGGGTQTDPECTGQAFGPAGMSDSVSPDSASSGVCAQVRLRIDQKAVLTRTAFAGTLDLENGQPDTALEGITVTLDIRDHDGNSANDLFVFNPPQLSTITGVDGTGELAAGSSGLARYLFIPTRNAVPEGPVQYFIGGTLRYLDDGREVIVRLLPATIIVYPDPVLKLEYFQERNVYSDDPHTDEVEPSEPFSLGLLVTNTGHGTANDFTITSAQPKIIENEKGLLIDFKIVGTEVNDQMVSPSLTADLGDLAPGQTAVAQWVMTSTLQGKFIDYSATFEHADDLGGMRTSLIDSVEIHELIHVVRADIPSDDGKPDFLVNDVPDPDSLPDTLYLSDGTVAPVNIATNATADGSVSLGHFQIHLTASMTSGWDYLTIPDPGTGYRLAQIVRSDGKVLRVGDNVWQTDRTFPSSLTGAVREHVLHLLDFNGTGSYTLRYVLDDSVPPVVQDVVDVAPDPHSGPVSSVDVVFSEPNGGRQAPDPDPRRGPGGERRPGFPPARARWLH